MRLNCSALKKICYVIALTGVFNGISKCQKTVNPSNKGSLKQAPNKHIPGECAQEYMFLGVCVGLATILGVLTGLKIISISWLVK